MVGVKPPSPFIIFGLPRSRTYWLSQFLTYWEWTCGHDEARHVRSLRDVKSWLSQHQAGTVETAAAPYWRLILSLRPDIRVVVIRRPVEEVVKSALDAGCFVEESQLATAMGRLDRKLDQIEKRVEGALSARFDDLRDEAVCRKIFEHCLPYEHDHARWKALDALNLQINLPALARYTAAFADQIRIAKSICDQESRNLLWKNRKPLDLDGMTIQEEPFLSFWQDGKKLFSQHCAEVDEESDQFFRKNIPLMATLDELGILQIVTARCNGRMFGYLMSVLSPSLEDDRLQVATQTTFYASRDAHGIGMKLQRAAIDSLKARGGRWDVVQRTGVRGDGPRMSAMYRRMGAADYGHLFKLSLGEN